MERAFTLGLWRGRTLRQGHKDKHAHWAVWASRRWRLEQRDDLAKNFAKFPTYWCVQVVVPKSSVPWFQLSTVCRLWTDWIPVSITVNHNACLSEIYIAIPRQLVDTKKTFGRLYLTVLDFSLLQRIHGQVMCALLAWCLQRLPKVRGQSVSCSSWGKIIRIQNVNKDCQAYVHANICPKSGICNGT